MIDVGTGDGLFVHRYAREHPDRFVIGIDPISRALAKISEKIHRKPAKGGLSNALFLQAAVEDLPVELEGLAMEVWVLFPWGSLLHAVATGAPDRLGNLRRLCAPGALLRVVLAIDRERDRTELEGLGVEPPSLEMIDSVLTARYRSAGFEIVERGELPLAERAKLQTTWSRKLGLREERPVLLIVARAV
ncbi:MAG TPA: class I SAM-dependent methyltransferase [Thermoanaerobaculia bacterium]|nr:class I SAM-dependent methyltransferase [Thermoanaerobaculia bacterium]